MSAFEFEVAGGNTIRLPTAGKYVPKNIVVHCQHNEEYIHQKVDEGYKKGQDEYVAKITYPGTANLQNGFTAVDFNSMNLSLTVGGLENNSSLYNAFYGNSTLRGLTLACSKNSTSYISYEYAFSMCYNLKYIDLSNFIRKIDSGAEAFYNCSKLTEIVGALDLSKPGSTRMMFSYCYELREVRFAPNIGRSINFAHCQYLSGASVQNIIDNIGYGSHIITFHSAVKEKLTDEQIIAIWNKGCTLG